MELALGAVLALSSSVLGLVATQVTLVALEVPPLGWAKGLESGKCVPKSHSAFPMKFPAKAMPGEQSQHMPDLKKCSFDKWSPEEIHSGGSGASPSSLCHVNTP